MFNLDYLERGNHAAIIGDKRLIKQIWEMIKDVQKELEEEE